MNKRISGKKIADQIKEVLKKEISGMQTKIIFSIIYVGQDPIIDNFIKYKEQFGVDVGVDVIVHNFETDVEQNILLSEIKNISKTADAMIVQLPLPEHLNTQTILDAIPSNKDVDVLSTKAKSFFKIGAHKMYPPVTGAMVEVLKYENFRITGKNVVLLGYGDLVGKPFGELLSTMEIPFDIITKETNEIEKIELLGSADLIICGAGVPHLLKASMIRSGVVLLDGGTSETGKKIQGDVHPNCYEKALFYTPVPGGIGPLTIAVLYQNILKSVNK